MAPKLTLIEAVQQNDITAGVQLLSQGADPNACDPCYGWSSLHISARDGKVGLARILLKYGANIEIKDTVGQTPLHRACFWGQRELVQFLIDNGADFTVLDSLDQTPIELAQNNQHDKVVALLKTYYTQLEAGTLKPHTAAAQEQMKDQILRKGRAERRRQQIRKILEKEAKKAALKKERLREKEQKVMERKRDLEEKIQQLEDDLACLHFPEFVSSSKPANPRISISSTISNASTCSLSGKQVKSLTEKLRKCREALEEENNQLCTLKAKFSQTVSKEAKKGIFARIYATI